MRTLCILAVLVILLNIQTAYSDTETNGNKGNCNSFTAGDYSCTFTPNSNYNQKYNKESFTLTLNKLVLATQKYTISSSSVCSNGKAEDGYLTIVDNSDFNLSTTTECSYILFQDQFGLVPVTNAQYGSSCDSFSGVAGFSTNNQKKGSLSCTLTSQNSNAATLFVSSALLCFAFLFF